MRPQVTGVEEPHKRFVMSADVCIGEHEGFELRLAGGPVGRAVPEQAMQIVEIIGAHGVTHLKSTSCVARLTEQCSESVAEEFVVNCSVAHRK